MAALAIVRTYSAHRVVADLAFQYAFGTPLPPTQVVATIHGIRATVEENLRNHLNGKLVTLCSDGWTSCRHCKHTNYMVVVDGRAHFVKSSHKRGHQTSLFLADEMDEVIKLLEEHFNCRVIATCTDNASAPIGAQKIIKERRPYMITLHCQAHSLQLLCKAAFKVEPCLAAAAAANKIANLLWEEKNGSNQSFDFIKDFKSSVKSLCD